MYAYNLKKDYNNFEKESCNYYRLIINNNDKFNKIYIATAVKYYSDALYANNKLDELIQLSNELNQKGYERKNVIEKINALKNGQINKSDVNYSKIYSKPIKE